MNSYFYKAAIIWFIAFSPGPEIYIAIPTGKVIGLDYWSTMFWSVTGNYTPILLIHYFYQKLLSIAVVKPYLLKLSSRRLEQWIDTYGVGFVLFATPWIGVWATSVTMKILRMNNQSFLIYSFISILLYAFVISTLIYNSVSIFKS